MRVYSILFQFSNDKKISYEKLTVLIVLLNSFLKMNEEKELFCQNEFSDVIFSQFLKLCAPTRKPDISSFLQIQKFCYSKHLSNEMKIKIFVNLSYSADK